MSNQLLKRFPFVLRKTRQQIAFGVTNTGRVSSRSLQTKADNRNATANVKAGVPLTPFVMSDDIQSEVQHHSNLAIDWWDTSGPVKALHSLNGLRVPFICDGLIARSNVSQDLVGTPNVLKNQKILEVGCGGGILTEQLARLGASVTALDLGEDLIQAAQQHLSQEANDELCDLIQYKIEPVDMHAKDKQNFYDAVVISEVLEHVDDKVGFLTASIQCLKPGGSVFVTTLNKTLSMWVVGVLIGEYILKAIPIGTHHYNKMVSPLDVQRILDTMGCHTVLVKGSVYNFWRNKWHWINSTSMFYALQAVKTDAGPNNSRPNNL